MSFPQIYESGMLNDYPGALYSTEETSIDHEQHVVTVRNDLRNCEILEKAIEAGSAVWSAELRSPHAFYSVFSNSGGKDGKISIAWDDSPLLPAMYLFSTLVATRNFEIGEYQGLSPIWVLPVKIPQGAILAKSRPHKIETDSHNLIHVSKSEKGSHSYLGAGVPLVKEDTMSSQVKYTVYLPEEIYTEKYDKGCDRSLLIGALAEALRQAAVNQAGKWERPDPQFLPLKEKLENIEQNWDDENFSPLIAASKLVPFEKMHIEEAGNHG